MPFARLAAVALAASLFFLLLAPSASALKLKFRYEVGPAHPDNKEAFLQHEEVHEIAPHPAPPGVHELPV